MELPRIMVAPTGARRTKADHPALPMTLREIVDCARACRAAGADAIHAHIRDDRGEHSLDIRRYGELVEALNREAPGMTVQISTEAVGRYSPPEQMALVRTLRPPFVSVALRELIPGDDGAGTAGAFYRWCAQEHISVQHILYDAADVMRLASLQEAKLLPAGKLSVIYVLGRYSVTQESTPDDLVPFMEAAEAFAQVPDWMVCAFGRGETACLEAALRRSGKVRVGFENSLWHSDGSVAVSNTERVAAIRTIADRLPPGE
ncbi:BKACE family enzyme [Rhizobium terrae]|uniref:3-keto-5-aminohexanoate cleavage protein n=1 Tax=Rhizobium terrae TaxID=2171756 RepID=UPI000E3DCB4B|nr:3-keto-5-aminohexanoate cleavage protein [Rhizobium terrae]